MDRRRFLKTVAGAALVPFLGRTGICNQPGHRKPNIIYILADDLGYGDLGCYGQVLIGTPNLDRLAREGMRFTQHYAGSAVCAPSRGVLLTGLHTGHCPIRNNRALKQEGNVPIPSKYVTLGEMMKAAGYDTGAFGKWGLGFPGSEGDPVNRGFDVFFGYNCQRQAHDYYPDHLWRNQDKVILRDNADGQEQDYSHDLIVEAALDFIRARRDRPFFAYVPFTIPHTRFQVPDLGAYGDTDWEKNHQIQAAMIGRMDRDVGRIAALVRELGLDDETLIFFTSDNGPHGSAGTLEKFRAAGPLRAKKGSLYEGGIRVPLIARWPGRIAAGTVSDHISGFQDVMPTFAELAGANAPKGIDGISFAPALTGTGRQRQHDYLYWELGNQQAVRIGPWKAVRRLGRQGAGPVELYHLPDDIAESKDLAKSHPDLVQHMEQILREARKPSKLFPHKVLDHLPT